MPRAPLLDLSTHVASRIAVTRLAGRRNPDPCSRGYRFHTPNPFCKLSSAIGISHYLQLWHLLDRESSSVNNSSFHPPQHPSPPYHLHCFAWFALTTTSLAPQTLIRSHRLFCPHVLCAKGRDLSDNIASTRITSGDNQLGASPARHCDCHGSASHPKSARVVRRTALPPCCDSRLTRSAHRCTASLRN